MFTILRLYPFFVTVGVEGKSELEHQQSGSRRGLKAYVVGSTTTPFVTHPQVPASAATIRFTYAKLIRDHHLAIVSQISLRRRGVIHSLCLKD